MIIPIPTDNQPDLEQPQHANEEERNRYIRWYIDCVPWKCVKCNATMFGRMKYCVYCKLKLGVDTLRPTSYVENTYEAG